MAASSVNSQTKETKQFLKTLKLYFSSLTARGAKYLFLNVAGLKNSFVITNGDYELLTSYVPVTLSIHIIEFKNSLFYEQFLRFLNLETTQPYVIRMNMFLKVINKGNIEDMSTIYDEKHYLKITTNDSVIEDDDDPDSEDYYTDDIDDDDTTEDCPWVDTSKWVTVTFDSAAICGQPVENVHALTVLENTIDKILTYPNIKKTEERPYAVIEVTAPVEYHTANYFRQKVSLQEFKTKEGLEYYPEKMHDLYVLLMDGFDVPSMKEFLKKTKKQVIELLLWANVGGTIQHMALYEDDEISIKSMRPFSEILPIRHRSKSSE